MPIPLAHLPREIGNYRLDLDVVIGRGSDASVHLALHVPTNTPVAVKVISIDGARQKYDRALFEVRVLRELAAYPQVVELYDVVEIADYLLLFVEYLPGGDFGSFVHRHGRLDEPIACAFFWQMLQALEHCHRHHLVHHDFKLENLLLATDCSLRLSDFGLALRLDPDGLIHSFTGSPLYMPPEIFSLQGHNQQVDVWSLGVSLYYMVTDMFPFAADTYHELEEKVLFDELIFPYNMRLSEKLQSLIRAMLHKDPKKRVTLAQVRAHPWSNQFPLSLHNETCIGTVIMSDPLLQNVVIRPCRHEPNHREANHDVCTRLLGHCTTRKRARSHKTGLDHQASNDDK